MSQCGVQISMVTRDSSPIQDIHTQNGAHPASYSIGSGAPCAKSKAVRGHEADHSPPSSAKVAFSQYNILVHSHRRHLLLTMRNDKFPCS
jgi:hypothetical protein